MKYKGLGEAVKEFKSLRRHGRVVMMVDFEDGEVWTDFYNSENEWKVYQSESIQSVDIHKIYYDNNCRLTVKGLLEQLKYQKKLYDSGK